MRNQPNKPLVLLVLLAALFSSCYTADKAQQQVNKADAKFPELVAKLARDKYPCSELLKNDTAIIFRDSTIFIECPDSNFIPNDYANVFTQVDTVTNTVTRTVRIPVKVLIPSKVITKWYEDSAKIKLLTLDINKLVKDNEAKAQTIVKQDKKISSKNKELWFHRIAWILVILWAAWRFYRRLTTIKIKNA